MVSARLGRSITPPAPPLPQFYVSNWIYSGNHGRDADKDGIACERA